MVFDASSIYKLIFFMVKIFQCVSYECKSLDFLLRKKGSHFRALEKE